MADVVAVAGVLLLVVVVLVLVRQRSVGHSLERDTGESGTPVTGRPAGPGAEATGADPAGGSTTAPEERRAQRAADEDDEPLA